jgi:ribonuclease HI
MHIKVRGIIARREGNFTRRVTVELSTNGEYEKEFYGSESKTTNNRMELRAVTAGLTALKRTVRRCGDDRL